MIDRRQFVLGSCAALAGSALDAGPAGAFPVPVPIVPQQASGLHLIRPVEGYSPQIGQLVSMAAWIRDTVVRSVRGMSQDELDHVYDSESNSIGSLLLHLASTEVFYQTNTFEKRTFNEAERRRWKVAGDLGEAARAEIKGHPLEYYLGALEEVRQQTLIEFRKRDDDWFQESEPFFGSQPTNNYCKWFHVVEHEANHRGQITWYEKRLPGHEFAKARRT
jgi:uncharacterized damage-inducible protein DinB